AIPLRKWLKQPGLREWAESLLDRKQIKEQKLLNSDNVEKIWKDYIEHDIWRQQIWHVLMFQATMF
ncbi:MAG: asparagine synthase-related protein, partial [Lachnoclostridium sp.]|nr:asparagine synthase-related protein [Lachnoclostridium sp.]